MSNKEHIVAITALIKNNSKNKVLIVKRHENEIAYPGYWAFPGGKAEIGERIIDTLKREVLEEVNLEIKNYKKFINDFNFTRKDGHNVIGLTFEVIAKEGEIKIPKEDFEEWRWVTPEEFKKLKTIKGMQKEINISFNLK